MTIQSTPRLRHNRRLALQTVKSLLETVCVRTFSLRQRLEPLGQLGKTFIPRRLGHTWIHLGIFVGFAFDRGLQIRFSIADGYASGRITDFLEKIEMAECMAGFSFGRIAEQPA